MKRSDSTAAVALAAALTVVLAAGPVRSATPDQAPSKGSRLGGIGVIGDSYSDEYQFYPPDRASARNWVEILATRRGLDFGPFSTRGRGEPRNQGYAYNWARSDATTDDMIAAGQHRGLAEQVARGEVATVVVFAGGNDFIYALHSNDPAQALERVRTRVRHNHRTILETLRAAKPDLRLVLITLPDIRNLPEFAGPLREGSLPSDVADAYTEAIAAFNNELRARARGDRNATLVDFDLATRVSNRLSLDYALIAGRRLDRTHTSNRTDHVFLADRRHIGTVGQALLAQMVVEALDVRFGAGVPRLTAAEIGRLADGAEAIASSGAGRP